MLHRLSAALPKLRGTLARLPASMVQTELGRWSLAVLAAAVASFVFLGRVPLLSVLTIEWENRIL